MQYISFPNATYLYLGISDNSSSTLAHRTTFRSIYSALPVSLRRLEIKIVSHQSERSAEVPLGPNAIYFDDFVQPLQFLRNLRELILCARLYNHTPEFLELLNGDLMSLIPSWPELVLFEYNVEHYSPYTYYTHNHTTARPSTRSSRLRAPILTSSISASLTWTQTASHTGWIVHRHRRMHRFPSRGTGLCGLGSTGL